MNRIPDTIKKTFRERSVVIVGDLVADQFLQGTIARVSREAPVFIMRHDETETRAGGAANAAVNVASLGGKPILIGLVGEDQNGKKLLDTLAAAGVDCDRIVTDSRFETTTKIRVLAGQHYAPRQQVIRIDYENRAPIENDVREKLLRHLISAGEDADAIIVSDYNYGVANTELVECARKISKKRQIPLLIDSRFRLSEFPDATTATPNQDEVEQILGQDFSESDCERLRRELRLQSMLVTRGNKGMLLVEKDRPPRQIDAVGSLEPVDVTGAGDTVIAVYALGLASGLSFLDAARVANHAGGIVVMKKGTASVSSAELLASIAENSEFSISDSATL